MDESVFTKIIKGEIPAHKIYEDKMTLAFLDINPTQPGHTLVVPKNQVEFLWDLPSEDYAALMITTKKVALHMREVLQKKYIGMKVIGEEVPHAHIHLIPFDMVSEYNAKPATRDNDNDDLAKMAELLRFK